MQAFSLFFSEETFAKANCLEKCCAEKAVGCAGAKVSGEQTSGMLHTSAYLEVIECATRFHMLDISPSTFTRKVQPTAAVIQSN